MTAQAANGLLGFAATSGTFGFSLESGLAPDPVLTGSSSITIKWVPGVPNTSSPNTAIHYLGNIHTNGVVYHPPWPLPSWTLSDPKDNPFDFSTDNFLHYSLGDLQDFGDPNIPADATRLRLFPFYPRHTASSQAEWDGWVADDDLGDGEHVDAGIKMANMLSNQTILAGGDFGAATYGAILYQLARKFFGGSAAEPEITDLIKAGNTVPGWHTGSMQGAGALSIMNHQFPHTYLGGNPGVCWNVSGADPCATGGATWPVWVPQQAPNPVSVYALRAIKPGRSNRAALVYLGWAAHMIQDLSLPHHASNWSGKEHQFQDDFGDHPELFPSSGDAQIADLLGPVSAPKSRDEICQSAGIYDSQVIAGSLNWQQVEPVFLTNARAAYYNRKEVANSADGAAYIKNAIIGTLKLLVCATPSIGYVPTKFASGFAWASSPTTPSYATSPAYSGNSSGAANSAQRYGTGIYSVFMPNLGNELGGNPQVTAYGGGAERCKVNSWGSVRGGTTLEVDVLCHNPAGQLVDTLFTASYVRRPNDGAAGLSGGYVYANIPTPEGYYYEPDRTYQWNSTGATNTVSRDYVGEYTVTFPGVNLSAGGTVEVTAVGNDSGYCKVGGWYWDQVNVNCFSNQGAPADSRFSVGYADHLDPNGNVTYHYAWADQPWTASYTPEPWYQYGYFNSNVASAGTMTMERVSAGNYVATIPTLRSYNSSTVIATAYGYTADTCKAKGWWSGPGGGTQVNIACYDVNGQPVDSYFTIVYSSTESYIVIP